MLTIMANGLSEVPISCWILLEGFILLEDNVILYHPIIYDSTLTLNHNYVGHTKLLTFNIIRIVSVKFDGQVTGEWN